MYPRHQAVGPDPDRTNAGGGLRTRWSDGDTSVHPTSRPNLGQAQMKALPAVAWNVLIFLLILLVCAALSIAATGHDVTDIIGVAGRLLLRI